MFTGLRARVSRNNGHSGRLPSFFIIGPPRTGTTWLHEVLGPSALLPSPTKETRFFDRYFGRGIDWYLDRYPAAPDAQLRMGEVAPTYFASVGARERIAKLIPSAKVVCVFRNPVDRVLSLYRLKRAYGMSPWTFDQAMLKDPELFESGRYATHLKTWLSLLGEKQVLAMVYEDLRRSPQAYLNTVTDFLGIARISLSIEQQRSSNASEGLTHPRSYFLTRAASGMAEWFKATHLDGLVAAAKHRHFLKFFLRSGSSFESLPAERIRKLYELFRPEVEGLEAILNRDFSAWKPAATRVGAVQMAVI